jgi:hypothetical protein
MAVASKRKKPSQKAVRNADNLAYKKVWKMMRENARLIKESDQMRKESEKKFDLELQKSREEFDRMTKKTDRQMKETDRQISKLGGRFGELAEHLVLPGIIEKFNKLNYTFERIYNDLVVTDSSGKHLAEIDIMLENGDTIMAVEVKAKPDKSDVDRHIYRIEVLRQRADARNDKRKFQGTIAGAIMPEETLDYIHKAGFYAIEQAGDTMRLNVPPNFKPREW